MFGNLIIQASLAAGTQVRISTYIEDLSAGLGNRFSADLKFIPRQDTDSTTSTAADQPAASSLAELYAHSCVVCAQSDYFSELFRKTTDEWDKLRDDMTLSDMVRCSTLDDVMDVDRNESGNLLLLTLLC
mgnify:CR=1 FL=1